MFRLSLRTAVIITLIAYHLVLIVFLVIPYASYIHELMEEELRVTGDETLKVVDVLLGAAGELDQGTQEQLSKTVSDSEIFEYLALSDISGNVIHTFPEHHHEDEHLHADLFGFFDFAHSTGHTFERELESGTAGRHQLLSLIVNTRPFNSRLAVYLYDSLKLAFLVMTAFLGIVLFADWRLRSATRDLIEKTRRMSEGELDMQINLRTGDAMEQLALSFNVMANSLRKRTSELTALKNLNESIVQSIDQGLVLIKQEGLIAHCNPSFAKLFGKSPDELHGLPLTTFLSYLSSSELAETIKRLTEGERVENRERSLPLVNGKLVVDEHWAILRDVSGGVEGFVLLITDVTEKARLTAELERYTTDLERLVAERSQKLKESQDQLIQAEKISSLGVFAAGVAHEISNPLAGILSTVELLQRRQAGGAQDAYEDIISNILRVQEIINDLVAYAKPTYSTSEDVDLNSLAERVVSFYTRQPKFKRHVIRFTPNLELGPITVDANKLEHVLHNLLLNALQATGEKGTITLSIHNDQPAGRVRIEVADDGPGVPREIRKDIFTPFYSTKPAGKGTGLGLSLSQRLILEMGGELWLAAGSEHGATFVVTLPAAPTGGGPEAALAYT